MIGEFWWFVARGSGIVAWVMMMASVIWGVLLATDLFDRWRRPAWILDLHRHLGGLAICFLAVHLGALVADSYVEFGLAELAIPYASEWKPGPVALGVVAAWGLGAVELTSLARKRLPKRLWRSVHLLSYAVFWLGTLHGTYAGTDAANPIYLYFSTGSLVAVIFAATYRVLNGRRRRPARRAKSDTTARTPRAGATAKPDKPAEPDKPARTPRAGAAAKSDTTARTRRDGATAKPDKPDTTARTRRGAAPNPGDTANPVEWVGQTAAGTIPAKVPAPVVMDRPRPDSGETSEEVLVPGLS